MPQKKQKPLPDKIQRRLDKSQEWTFFKARGIEIERVLVGQELIPIDIESDRCYECKAKRGIYHSLGCPNEFLNCCGKLAVECECQYHENEAEPEGD